MPPAFVVSAPVAPPAPAAVENASANDAIGKWSFGAGVGTGFYGDSIYISSSTSSAAAGLGSLGGLAGASGGSVSRSSLLGVGLVERLVSQTLRVGMTVTGSYAHSNSHTDNVDGPRDGNAGNAGLGASLRWVLNPGQVVEASPLIALGGFWTGSTARYATTTMETASGNTVPVLFKNSVRDLGLEARLGFVVEYRLIPRLYLRLEAHFARFAYDRAKSVSRTLLEGQAPTALHTTSNNVNLNFGFQPMLQLRIVL